MNNFIIGNSQIEGRGLFATRDFRKGEQLHTPNDKPEAAKIYTDKEFEEFISWCKDNGKQWDAVSLGNGKHRAAIADRDNHPENYVNHSCEPNLDKNHITLRDIKQGDELTIDYAQFSSTDWSMNCNCGSKLCRGVVIGTVR